MHSRGYGTDHREHKQLANEGADKNSAINRWAKVKSRNRGSEQIIPEIKIHRSDNQAQLPLHGGAQNERRD